MLVGSVCSCTKIPLDTPLARLVTADPAIEMIEHDLVLLRKCEWLIRTITAVAIIRVWRGAAPHQAVGDTRNADPSIMSKFKLAANDVK